MAVAFTITQAVAQSLLTAFETAANAGTAAVIEIRSGAAPGPDEAAGGVLLATLTCNASIFTSKTDGAPGAVGTLAAVSSDTSADDTGTAAHFRLLTQTGGTAIAEGTVGTATSDLILNTVSITAGSTVSITSGTITVPES